MTGATGKPRSQQSGRTPGEGEVAYWSRSTAEVYIISARKPRQARRRHTRKYAEGDLGEDKSFYFRGPQGELNLRAQNLMLFLQLAEGVDEATWLHHLHAGDYSAWFREAIKDDGLAEEVAAIECDRTASPLESRARIAEAVTRRYTAPAAAEK